MRLIPALLASAALLAGAPALAQAQRDTITQGVPTQLPRTAVPSHYAITITPHADQLTFDGSVAIDLRVTQPTQILVLNAADLAIAKAKLTGTGLPAVPAKVTLNAEEQTATFDFGRTLAPGAYRLAIDYSGKINKVANGLFALDYKNKEGQDARALFTQFEAADARRFVPSWDEPDYKATFDLTARVPKAQMALSNMPAVSTRDIGDGLAEVKFATSPVMSSYLLFFGLGDLERISKKVGQHEVGIVMARGSADKARYALDAEAQVLPYLEDYFGVPYPLPKLDNIAGPGQSQFFGAMENWGAIFTFEYLLLDDPAITTESGRQSIYSTQAHEMAHQWFGNLVTMAWWDDLWLNEGFASWMANRVTQHFHPDWGADVSRVASSQFAMELDSFSTTHPIVQEVRTVEQANQAFDTITYQKGQAVISMLEGFAGEDVWRSGIQSYMKKHAYRNTRTSDLWAAMENAGARSLMTVANDFTSQPGVPLIVAGTARCVNGNTVVPVTQTQFSKDERAKVAASPLSWHVPVQASAGGATALAITQNRAARLQVPGCGTLLINPGQSGYYRTLYTAEQAQALRAAYPQLSPVDQYGLLSNAISLSSAAYQPMDRALDLLASVPANANQKVAQLAVGAWSHFYEKVDGNAVAQRAIAERIRSKFGPRLTALGFVPRKGEPALDAVLRSSLIGEFGSIGDGRVVSEANKLFTEWLTNPGALPGSLKSQWLGIVARNATPDQWDALHAAARRTTGTVERASLYRLLAVSPEETLATRALQLALTDEPGAPLSASMISAVAERHPELALDFALANLDRVNAFVDLSSRSSFIAGLADGSDDPATIAKLRSYAAAHLKETDRKPIEEAINRIEYRAANEPRIRAEVEAWLAQNRR